MAIEENPGILLYMRIRKSPYYYASRQHGVRRYSVYNHAYHPRHYGDPVQEYWTLLDGVTMWDVGVERQIEISGPDAFTFTNMMTPRDLSKCAVRQAKYAFITLPDGGIANDPVLLGLEENRFWLSLVDSDIGLWAHLDVTIGEVDVAPVQSAWRPCCRGGADDRGLLATPAARGPAKLMPTLNFVICYCLAGRLAELKAGNGRQHARVVQA